MYKTRYKNIAPNKNITHGEFWIANTALLQSAD